SADRRFFAEKPHRGGRFARIGEQKFHNVRCRVIIPRMARNLQLESHNVNRTKHTATTERKTQIEYNCAV
ncbi:MAG: hypothetical protein FWF79_00535, partial [Defluviitaleaceae bacterium]|nr:hypothetical protein [Defluviitaleaceae bacterium]